MKIEILGKPIPLQRARSSSRRFYDPQYEAKKNYVSEVLAQITDPVVTPFLFPIELRLHFKFKLPNSFSKKKKRELLNQPHQGKIDLDNLIKWIGDSLNTHIWKDDSQIWKISAKKTWALEDKTIINIS